MKETNFSCSGKNADEVVERLRSRFPNVEWDNIGDLRDGVCDLLESNIGHQYDLYFANSVIVQGRHIQDSDELNSAIIDSCVVIYEKQYGLKLSKSAIANIVGHAIGIPSRFFNIRLIPTKTERKWMLEFDIA